MKEEILSTISPQQAQKILSDGGLEVTLEQATAILQFLNKMAQITLDVYMVKPE
jgi:hypothetical protein